MNIHIVCGQYAQYVGTIKFQRITGFIVIICTHDDGSATDSNVVPLLISVVMDITGKAVDGGVTGKIKPPRHPIPEITITGNWTFAGLNP
jgi:hypothetical protein